MYKMITIKRTAHILFWTNTIPFLLDIFVELFPSDVFLLKLRASSDRTRAVGSYY